MRIALFSGNYNYVREGANQALNKLVAYLELSGHRVRIYSPVGRTAAFEPAGTLVPVRSVALPVRGEFRLGLGLSRRLRRDIRSFEPDLFHVSTPDWVGARAQTLARALNKPVVASLHTRFERYLDYYGLGLLKPALEAHLRRFYRRSDAVLVPNAGMVEELQAVSAGLVEVWSRGVDRDQFNPSRRSSGFRTRHGIGENEIAVLFFGRLVLEKGVDLFVEAVERLQASGTHVRPLIVGAGPAADRFRELPGVVLAGHLDGVELAEAIASADLMLTPSTTEAFGNVVLEAMASGLAIISADAPSAEALLHHEQTGLLVPGSELSAYVASAKRLIGHPAERRRLGLAAREASAAYSWDAASEAVEDVYEKVLEFAKSKRTSPAFLVANRYRDSP